PSSIMSPQAWLARSNRRPNYARSFQRDRGHRDLHSFPTRRSSDLQGVRNPVAPAIETAQLTAIDQLQAIAAHQGGQHFRILGQADRKSTRLNSSHVKISYAVFCLKKKKNFHLLPSAAY